MKILYILIFTIICFILNIVAYYMSENYRSLLREFKGIKGNEIVLIDDYNIDTSNTLIKDENISSLIEEKKFEKSLEEEAKFKLEEKVAFIRAKEKEDKEFKNKQDKVDRVIKNLEKKDNVKAIIKEKRNEIKSGLKKVKVSHNFSEKSYLSAYDKKVLKLFKKYNLVELEYHGDLLDVTSEYPDEYFEYYTMDLTLLIFPTKNYKDVKDIFSVISNGYNFMLNEVDNFGEESFYVNLGEDYIDGYIRVIFTKNDRVYGFKVIKSEYSNVKNILKKL